MKLYSLNCPLSTSGSFRKRARAGAGAGVTAVGGCRHGERVEGGGLNPGERSPQSVGNRRMGSLKSQVRAFGLDATEKAVAGNSYAASNLFQKIWRKIVGFGVRQTRDQILALSLAV